MGTRGSRDDGVGEPIEFERFIRLHHKSVHRRWLFRNSVSAQTCHAYIGRISDDDGDGWYATATAHPVRAYAYASEQAALVGARELAAEIASHPATGGVD